MAFQPSFSTQTLLLTGSEKKVEDKKVKTTPPLKETPPITGSDEKLDKKTLPPELTGLVDNKPPLNPRSQAHLHLFHQSKRRHRYFLDQRRRSKTRRMKRSLLSCQLEKILPAELTGLVEESSNILQKPNTSVVDNERTPPFAPGDTSENEYDKTPVAPKRPLRKWARIQPLPSLKKNKGQWPLKQHCFWLFAKMK
jgi:hypothetical protein